MEIFVPSKVAADLKIKSLIIQVSPLQLFPLSSGTMDFASWISLKPKDDNVHQGRYSVV